jgi:hypothetical protein
MRRPSARRQNSKAIQVMLFYAEQTLINHGCWMGNVFFSPLLGEQHISSFMRSIRQVFFFFFLFFQVIIPWLSADDLRFESSNFCDAPGC